MAGDALGGVVAFAVGVAGEGARDKAGSDGGASVVVDAFGSVGVASITSFTGVHLAVTTGRQGVVIGERSAGDRVGKGKLWSGESEVLMFGEKEDGEEKGEKEEEGGRGHHWFHN